MRSPACHIKRLQALRAVAFRHCVRNIGDRLRRLTDRAGRDQFVGGRVDRGYAVGIFEPDINSAAVAGWPDAVRQLADRNRCDLREVVGAKYLDLVQSADGHVSKGAIGGPGEIDVVGDRPGVDRLQHGEWRLRVEHHSLADVLQRKPDLLAVGRGGDVRTERAVLLDMADDLMIGDGDDHGLRIKGGADIAVLAVWREDLHARSGRHLDARFFLKALPVEHGDVVLAADRDPELLAIGREKRLMRRAADIGGVLNRVGRGIDEGDGVRADRNHRDGLVIG